MAKNSTRGRQARNETMRKGQCKCMPGCGTGGAAYGLGVIGALVYYVTTAATFWLAVLGFFKALVWPAFLVYGLLKLLGM